MAALLALVLFIVAVSAWTGLGWLLVSVAPTAPMATASFYVLAFAGIAATASLVSWIVRRPRSGGSVATPASMVGHGMLLAGISLFGLWLQSLRMLTLTVMLLLVGLYVFLELALLFGTRGAVDLDLYERPEPALAD